MKRKPIYIALGSVFAVIALVLLVMPSRTRSMFFWEFKQNVAEMFGFEEEPIEGEEGKEGGLRSESPEEYGVATGAPGGEQDGEPGEGDDAATDETTGDAGEGDDEATEPSAELEATPAGAASNERAE